jgi:hypothetical protein
MLRGPRSLITTLREMDPRRSLVAGIIWLMIALAASFALAASLWAGRVARKIVLQQHVRRLELETGQLASDLGQALNARLEALRGAPNPDDAPALYRHLLAAYPDLGWIGVCSGDGTVQAAADGLTVGRRVNQEAWFSAGLTGPWIGRIDAAAAHGQAPLLGDLAAPVTDLQGRVVAVAAAHLNWHWASSDVQRLSDTARAISPIG